MWRVDDSIGARIAAYRKRKGMTQALLAGLVGRSESWLSQVERGARDVDRLSVLLRLAELLNVTVEMLTGKAAPARDSATAPALLDGVRAALTRYDRLATAPTRLPPFPQLRALVVETHRAYQSARYAQTARMLPAVLAGVDAYQDASRPVQVARSSAYAVAAKLLTKVGDADLAWVAADRAATAALAAESLPAEGLAAYQVTCALLRAGHGDRAEQVAVGAAERLMRRVGEDNPELLSLTGALWLIAAVIAARHADRPTMTDRFTRAAKLAETLGIDANHGHSAFGPTNVVLHRVSAAVRMGDPLRVLSAAATVNTNALPVALNGRRASLHLDLATAQAQRRHDPEAVFHLIEAERIAPELLRYYVTAHVIIRDLLRRERRAQTPALRPLAARAGVL